MRTRIPMLLLAASALVLSACSAPHPMGHRGHRSMDAAVEGARQEIASLLDRTLQSDDKAGQAKALVNEIVEEASESRQRDRAFHQALYDLNASYDAEPEAFLRMLDEINAKRMQSASRILRLRFDLKGLMTKEQWQQFTDGLDDMRSRYQPRGAGG